MKHVLVILMIAGFAPVSLSEVFVLSPPAVLDSCNEEFENVANALQPGDELILSDGVYSQSCARRIDINGTAEAPIIIRAADGASPLITRPNSTSSQQNNIEISGSYFTIRGLRFQYGSSGVRFRGSHHITFENNKIFDTLNNALSMNSGATDSHVVRNNEIYNTGLADGDTEGEGMYLGGHNGNSRATNHLIENNYIHDLRGTSSGGNDGIEVKFGSGGNIIRGNIIHNTVIGQDFPCIFVYGHGDNPNIVEGNLVFNCGEAILVTADAIIRNNVILDSSINGIHVRQQNPAPSVRNVTIVNNTVYGSHPECIRFRTSSASNIVVANNAIYCESSTAVAGSGLSNVTFTNNYVRGGLSGVSIDNAQFFQGSESALNFVNAAQQDFRLVEGSDLIDAGVTGIADHSDQDFAGEARVSGASIDVGAYEFASSGGVTPELELNGPASVVTNNPAMLSWRASGVSSCEASGGWQGSRATVGTETTAALTVDTLFTLTCTGQNGSVAQSLTVVVVPPPPDSDDDGLLDTWEIEFFGNLNQTATADPDADSLNNLAEFEAETDPTDGDTDDDGLNDGEEVNTYNTDPLTGDTDGDGSSDFDEVQAGSDPLDPTSVPAPSPDSDEDGLLDVWEIDFFGNLDQTGIDDPDDDSLNNLAEFEAETDPSDGDTDDDGLNDGEEVSTYNTDPLNADTDGDGSSDFDEVQAGSDPLDSTSVPAPLPDSDDDGLLDAWELENFGNLDQTAVGDPDADLLSNLDELEAQTNPNDGDTDNDGLNDGEEVSTYNTNPLSSDSDDDGSSDFDEIQAGSDPLDSSSMPESPSPAPIPMPPPDPVPTPAPVQPIEPESSDGGGGIASPFVLLGLAALGYRRRFRNQ